VRSGPVFTRYGSDKATLHRYDRAYDLILPLALATNLPAMVLRATVGLGTEPRHFLEIGYGQEPRAGAGAHAWKVLLPDWVHHSVDLKFPEEIPPWLDPCYADTADAGQLMKLASVLAADSFHLIVDDGSHEVQDQKNALNAFWPLLAPGGFYAIEDVRSPGEAEPFATWPGYILFDTRAVSGRFDDLMVVLRKPAD
jgi:hypothetical protein